MTTRDAIAAGIGLAVGALAMWLYTNRASL